MPLVFSPATSSDGGARLDVLDYRRQARTATADATGTATVTFDAVPAGQLWLVERFAVSSSSSTQTTCQIYAGDPAPANLVDGTTSGNLDVADEASPILIDSSLSLNAQWTGASSGASCTVTVQYQLVQRN